MPRFPYSSFEETRPNRMQRGLDFVLLLDNGASMNERKDNIIAFLFYLFEQIPLKMDSMGLGCKESRVRIIPFGGKPITASTWFASQDKALVEYFGAIECEDSLDPLSPVDAFSLGLKSEFRKEDDIRQVFILISNAPGFGSGIRQISAEELIDQYWDGNNKKGKGCLCGYHKRTFFLLNEDSLFLELTPYLYGVSSFGFDSLFKGQKEFDKALVEKKLNDIVFSLACN